MSRVQGKVARLNKQMQFKILISFEFITVESTCLPHFYHPHSSPWWNWVESLTDMFNVVVQHRHDAPNGLLRCQTSLRFICLAWCGHQPPWPTDTIMFCICVHCVAESSLYFMQCKDGTSVFSVKSIEEWTAMGKSNNGCSFRIYRHRQTFSCLADIWSE